MTGDQLKRREEKINRMHGHGLLFIHSCSPFQYFNFSLGLCVLSFGIPAAAAVASNSDSPLSHPRPAFISFHVTGLESTPLTIMNIYVVSSRDADTYMYMLTLMLKLCHMHGYVYVYVYAMYIAFTFVQPIPFITLNFDKRSLIIMNKAIVLILQLARFVGIYQQEHSSTMQMQMLVNVIPVSHIYLHMFSSPMQYQP